MTKIVKNVDKIKNNWPLIDGASAGARIWMGRITEEIRGGTGPYVVAQYPRPSFTFPVC